LDDLDELAVFGTRLDVCAAEYELWPSLRCNLLAGHKGPFHTYEWYEVSRDMVGGFSWRED